MKDVYEMARAPGQQQSLFPQSFEDVFDELKQSEVLEKIFLASSLVVLSNPTCDVKNKYQLRTLSNDVNGSHAS